MFTTNPKCAPSRASILTGMHTWQLKEACTHWNVFPAPEEFDLYPSLLEAHGYHVGFTGKGWGPGDYKRRGHKRNPAGTEYNTRSLTPPKPSLISNTDYAANFEDFLKAREAGEPFCFWYGGREPHRHYVNGEGIAHGKKLSDVPESAIPPYWPKDDIVRRDMLDYAYEIEWFDAQLGKMLEQLERIGELENTLVIVTSDNGCPFPRVKGMMLDDDFRLPFVAMGKGKVKGARVARDLCSFVDLMPTFLELAGIEVPKKLPGRSLMDVLGASGSGMITQDRTRAWMGRERHDVGGEGDRGYPVRCVRTPEYLYVRNFAPERWPACNPETGYPGCDGGPTKDRILALHKEGQCYYHDVCFGKRPAEELYHIPSDPSCMKNLAQDPAHEGIRAALWRELEQKLRDTQDPRIFANGDIFDSYEYVGHDNARHSWRHYVQGKWQPQGH